MPFISSWLHFSYFWAFLPKLLQRLSVYESPAWDYDITIMTYLWKNWPKRPLLGAWSDILARRVALSWEPRFCSARLAKAGMKPELCWWSVLVGRCKWEWVYEWTYSTTTANIASSSTGLGSTRIHYEDCLRESVDVFRRSVYSYVSFTLGYVRGQWTRFQCWIV